MRIEVRSDKVIIEGYVNAVARDSRPIRDKVTGRRFVEQIVPGAFKRALKHNEVKLLLNHDETRVLGSTATNLQLYEDNIGLRARAEITDAEVIEKARLHKLRGWSFGFHELDASEEPINENLNRRFVEELELVEVSIIDERKIPVYQGTSIETRAKGKTLVITDTLEVRATYAEEAKEQQSNIDYSKYKNRLKELEEKNESI